MLPLIEINFGPLLPQDLSEILVGLVLFGIILIAMQKVVVPMFEKTYAERAGVIQGGIERAVGPARGPGGAVRVQVAAGGRPRGGRPSP